MRKPYHARKLLAVSALAATTLLGGCGGVQFEGAVFEKLGLGEKQKQTDAVMPERAPLILPPQRQLPQPGPRQVVSNPQAWPQDPDLILKKQAADKKIAEKRHCSEGTWSKKSSIREFEEINDPLLRCKGLGTDKDLSDESRGDGSPDTLIENTDHNDTSAATPWRGQITQKKPSQ